MKKRGLRLSTSAIRLIVLGVIVLVVLVIGFTIGLDKLTPWVIDSDDDVGDSKNNVEAIKAECNTACFAINVDDYCKKVRTIRFEGIVKGLNVESGNKITCNDIAGRIGVSNCANIC